MMSLRRNNVVTLSRHNNDIITWCVRWDRTSLPLRPRLNCSQPVPLPQDNSAISIFIIHYKKYMYKQRVWPHVSVTLSLKGQLGADYARVPWSEGSLRPESPKPTLQADNSTQLTACQEGLALGPWKITLPTPNPGTTSYNLPIHAVHILWTKYC